jgi:dCTP deaminase
VAAPHSVLSDGTIRSLVASGRVVIDPWDPELIQPASVDLRLGDSFRVFHNHRAAAIDLREPPTNLTEEVVVAGDDPFVIHPGEFVLGLTKESVTLPDDVAARIDGRSSLGRLGIVIHSTAGHIDPGFSGNVTLEITNIGQVPVLLYPDMRVAQLVFESMSSPVEVSYAEKKGAKYSGTSTPGASKLFEESPAGKVKPAVAKKGLTRVSAKKKPRTAT